MDAVAVLFIPKSFESRHEEGNSGLWFFSTFVHIQNQSYLWYVTLKIYFLDVLVSERASASLIAQTYELKMKFQTISIKYNLCCKHWLEKCTRSFFERWMPITKEESHAKYTFLRRIAFFFFSYAYRVNATLNSTVGRSVRWLVIGCICFFFQRFPGSFYHHAPLPCPCPTAHD